MKIIPVTSSEQVEIAKDLFKEYAASLNFNLCFQNFDKELAELPGGYSPPSGLLLLAEYENKTAGCAALRKINDEMCEMKRLYVKPEFRGKGIGKFLAENVIEEARRIGYEKMRLDTLPIMKEAISMYKRFGFKEIPSYRYNPEPGALFMELEL